MILPSLFISENRWYFGCVDVLHSSTATIKYLETCVIPYFQCTDHVDMSQRDKYKGCLITTEDIVAEEHCKY